MSSVKVFDKLKIPDAVNSFSERFVVRYWCSEIAPKQFCKLFGLILVTGLAAIATLNFIVDPYAQYATGILPPVVQTTRIEKVAALSAMPDAPCGLILGSSRVLKIEPEYLKRQTGFDFYNAGVNYARPEDILAIVRFIESSKKNLPKICIMGLDVAAFNETIPPDERLIANRQLRPFASEVMSIENRLRTLTDLITFKQTKSSISSIAANLSGSENIPHESFQTDGLIVYHHRECEIKAGRYDLRSAIDYNCREYLGFFDDYPRLSALRCHLLDLAIEKLTSSECEVYLFLTPNHPELASVLTEKTSFRDREHDLEQFCRDLAQQSNVHFENLSDLASFEGDSNDFVDAIHPLEFNTRLMMNRLFGVKHLVGQQTQETLDVIQ